MVLLSAKHFGPTFCVNIKLIWSLTVTCIIMVRHFTERLDNLLSSFIISIQSLLLRVFTFWTSSVEQDFNNFSFLALWWLNIVAVVIFFLIFRFFNYWLCFHLPINSRSSSSNFLLSNDIFVNKNCPQIEPEPCECVSALKWKQVQCTLFLNTLKTNFDAFQHQARAFWLPEKCLIPKHIEVCFEGPTRSCCYSKRHFNSLKESNLEISRDLFVKTNSIWVLKAVHHEHATFI